MSFRSARFAAAALACALPLSACGTGGDSAGVTGTQTPLEVTTPTGAPKEEFQVSDGNKITSNELSGKPVDDPEMELSYIWQGSSSAPNGGSVVVVAVKNKSNVAMPVDALPQPTLRYTSGGNNKQNAAPQNAEQSGVDIIGFDEPVSPGATVNAKYAFDVAPDNLWNAELTIGNVTFSGDLTG